MKRNIIKEAVRRSLINFINEDASDDYEYDNESFDDLEANDRAWETQDSEFDDDGQIDDIDFNPYNDGYDETSEDDAVRRFEMSQNKNDEFDFDLDEHPEEWPANPYTY